MGNGVIVMTTVESLHVRKLSGMQYESVEVEHPVSTPMSEILYVLANHLANNDDHGILTGLYTQSHPDDDSLFLTNLVWAI